MFKSGEKERRVRVIGRQELSEEMWRGVYPESVFWLMSEPRFKRVVTD